MKESVTVQNRTESKYETLVFQLQEPSDQEVEEFLNQEGFLSNSSSRRSSANSLFLKAMDGRPRRRRSLYSLATRVSGGPQSPEPPYNRRSSLKDPPVSEAEDSVPSDNGIQRRQSSTELLLAPLKQFVAQSQKAFEYLSPSTPNNTAGTPIDTVGTPNDSLDATAADDY